MLNKSKSRYFVLVVSLFICIALIACNGQQPDPTEAISASSPVVPVPSPETGKATVSGQVIDVKTNQPIHNVFVRVARIVREGDEAVFVLEDAFSPGDLTDEQGYFAILNVDPIEYVIVVGDVYLYHDIIDEGGKATVWVTKADEILDVGVLNVDLK